MDIGWICFDCAEAVGSRVPEGHLCTVHVGTCDVCGKNVAVTEPRDFRPRPDVLYNQKERKETK